MYDQKLELTLKDIIYQAGEIALFHRKNGLQVFKKPDSSPVSNGDIEVSNFIYNNINNLAFGFPIICEEQGYVEIEDSRNFWLIDPIDGTSSYINNKDSFTINIALIIDNAPLLGFILQPTLMKLYYTSFKNELIIEVDGIKQTINPRHDNKKIAIVSSNHFNNRTERYLKSNNFDEVIALASSIKLCYLAEGIADIYPKFSTTMEWDIAAGHAIVNISGGKIEDIEGKELSYGKPGFINPHFIAFANKNQSRKIFD